MERLDREGHWCRTRRDREREEKHHVGQMEGLKELLKDVEIRPTMTEVLACSERDVLRPGLRAPTAVVLSCRVQEAPMVLSTGEATRR